MADPRLESLALSLSKIQHKKYELYVLTRIIHKLDHNIKCVFQQYVQRDPETLKYALIDLYLPDLKIAIEVDEDYHLGQLSEDVVRQEDIMQLDQSIKIERINCANNLADIDDRIDEVVKMINCKAQGKLLSWDGLTGYEHYYKTKILDVNDTTELTSPSEICNCFGLDKVYFGGSRKVSSGEQKYTIWWAKEHSIDKNGRPKGDWYNAILDDGDTIIEYRLNCTDEERESHCNSVRKNEENVPRVTFYRKKSAIGGDLFRFMGIYTVKIDEHTDGKLCCKWTRRMGRNNQPASFKLPEYYSPDKLLEDLEKLEDELSRLENSKRVEIQRERIKGAKEEINNICESIDKRDINNDIKDWYQTPTKYNIFKPFTKELNELQNTKDYDNYVEKEIRGKWEQAKELERNIALYKVVKNILKIKAFVNKNSQSKHLGLSCDRYGEIEE